MFEKQVIESFRSSGRGFCLWKEEKDKKGEKIIYPYPAGQLNFEEMMPATYASFDEAASSTQGFDGIGIGIIDDLAAVIIKYGFNGGKLTTMAEAVIKKFDSYTEIAPNGTDVVILLSAKPDLYDRFLYSLKNSALGLEIRLSSDRIGFIPLSGAEILDRGIEERSDILESFLNKYMIRKVLAGSNDQLNGFITDEGLRSLVWFLNPLSNKAYDAGELGMGNLLSDVYRWFIKYCPERNAWFFFDGKKWILDSEGVYISELFKALSYAYNVYIVDSIDGGSGAGQKDLFKKAEGLYNRQKRASIIKDARSRNILSYNDLDSKRSLFNCANGVLDLKTGTFRDHHPKYFCSKMSSVIYDPSAKSKLFDQFIDQIMDGDQEKKKFLQKCMGYALSGDTSLECFFILYGPTGRNGKSTLIESVRRVLGDYALTVKPETLAKKNQVNSQAPSEDIARLAGIRFASVSEPDRDMRLNEALIKNLTGNDRLNARFLHSNSFDFDPHFKIYFNTNYLPRVSDVNIFTSGRVYVIPFLRHFDEAEQNKNLKSDLAKPEVQSAILNWLIEGYFLLKKEGLNPPESVLDSTEKYKDKSDHIGRFFKESLVEDPERGEVKTQDLFSIYILWAKKNTENPVTQRVFKAELEKNYQDNVVRGRPKNKKNGTSNTSLLRGYKLTRDAEALVEEIAAQDPSHKRENPNKSESTIPKEDCADRNTTLDDDLPFQI